MSFWGATFVFDGVPSETHSLYISSQDGGSVDVTGSSDVELFTESVLRRSTPYLLGVQQSPVLEFDVSLNSPREITSVDLGIIQAWLFGHKQYKKLQIVQSDIQEVYYNCFLKNPRVNKDGNIIRGIRATVVCDAPWGWTFDKTKTYSYSSGDINENIIFNNISDDNGYLYPTVQFTMNEFGGNFTITNSSDGGRQFIFTDLTQNEVVTVNNDLNIISSSLGLRRLGSFNKKWFRMVRGVNQINFSGNVSEVKFTYKFAKKVSG